MTLRGLSAALLFAAGGIGIGIGGCGARSELPLDGEGGAPAQDGPCEDGVAEPCGSSVGECRPGRRVCKDGVFGECVGAIEPSDELCNGKDDDCDGEIDEPFGVGQACDGPDSDFCLDDVMTCGGCSTGPDAIELCNGKDDDCDGIIDADCETGDCQPRLLVTGSVPSSPGCVDFPVEAGSEGVIVFPCGGGSVSAQLGSVLFSGSVSNGVVTLTGSVVVGPPQTPDGCAWQTDHAIFGALFSGTLTYTYDEFIVSSNGACWSPCTEVGTIEIQWGR